MYMKDQFLADAVAEVRGFREKKMVREELAGHLEDRMESLRESGLSAERAEAEAVRSMGNVRELAEELGRIHSYDTGKAYGRMIFLLWLGILLPWIPIGSPEQIPVILRVLGSLFQIYALFRLRKVGPHLKRAFAAAWVNALLLSLLYTARVMPPQGMRTAGELVFGILSEGAQIWLIYELMKGLAPLASYVEDRLRVYLGYSVFVLFTPLVILLFDYFGIHVAGFLLVILLLLVLYFAVASWGVMTDLLKNEETGIDAAPWYSTVLIAAAFAVLVCIPFTGSVIYSRCTVKEIPVSENSAADFRDTALARTSKDGKSYADLSGAEKEKLESFLEAVPAGAWERLAEAEQIVLHKEKLNVTEEAVMFLEAEFKEEWMVAQISCNSLGVEKRGIVTAFSIYSDQGTYRNITAEETIMISRDGRLFRLEGYDSQVVRGPYHCISVTDSVPSFKAEKLLTWQAFCFLRPLSGNLRITTEQSVQKWPWRIPLQKMMIETNGGHIPGVFPDEYSTFVSPLYFNAGQICSFENVSWRRDGTAFYLNDWLVSADH